MSHLYPPLFDLCPKKILIPDIMGDQPTEETQFVVDEVVRALKHFTISNWGNNLAV